MGDCVIDMDDQLSISSTDLSCAPFRQWNKCIDDIMVGVEFDPFEKTLTSEGDRVSNVSSDSSPSGIDQSRANAEIQTGKSAESIKISAAEMHPVLPDVRRFIFVSVCQEHLMS
jgi:hypothetical protein